MNDMDEIPKREVSLVITLEVLALENTLKATARLHRNAGVGQDSSTSPSVFHAGQHTMCGGGGLA